MCNFSVHTIYLCIPLVGNSNFVPVFSLAHCYKHYHSKNPCAHKVDLPIQRKSAVLPLSEDTSSALHSAILWARWLYKSPNHIIAEFLLSLLSHTEWLIVFPVWWTEIKFNHWFNCISFILNNVAGIYSYVYRLFSFSLLCMAECSQLLCTLSLGCLPVLLICSIIYLYSNLS